ncbi:MAG: hypothetical protein CM15mP95_2340 [Alphaproteobacteria bacterium]|nr:MAG: hypothetical protein CM15mP95_2340 [Alphaproteobacteria bacterium]
MKWLGPDSGRWWSCCSDIKWWAAGPAYRTMWGKHILLPVHVKNPLRWPGVSSPIKNHFPDRGRRYCTCPIAVPAWLALNVAKSMGIATVSTVHSRFTSRSFLKRHYNAKLLDAGQVIAISDYVHGLITSQHLALKTG